MDRNTDIFKVESNKLLPEKGKLLISEPFLKDVNFGRSVILLVDHNDQEGTMGLIMNKKLPFHVNDFVDELKYYDPIPLYRGGPVSTDTLFYLHPFGEIEGSIPLTDGVYLNGDFTTIKRYILQGNALNGEIRFFLGYSGWDPEQLRQEIDENTWFIGNTNLSSLMDISIKDMWKVSLGTLGKKYEAWARFPQNPLLN